MAREAGLSAFALTDHDCLDGLQEFVDAAEGFLAVCGVEISARRESSDVHILGLFIDPGNEKLNRHLDDLAHSRRTRSSAMVERLRVLGIEIREDDVTRFSGQGTVGRPHVAHALVEMGVVPSVDEAFRRFLRPGTPGFVPKPGPTPAEAIVWVHEAGGIAVLAHPGPLRHDAWIAEMAAAGLDGIEVWHPKHNSNQRATYLRMARDLGLVASGGSDYHGTRVGDCPGRPGAGSGGDRRALARAPRAPVTPRVSDRPRTTRRPSPPSGATSMTETERLALFAAFLAAVVVAGLGLSLVPHVELVTLVVFSAGIVLGAGRGALIGAVGMTLYVFANSAARGFPPSPLPLLAAQALGMALARRGRRRLAAMVAVRRTASSHRAPRAAADRIRARRGSSRRSRTWSSRSCSRKGSSARWPVFWSGMAFGILDTVVNALVFAIAGPALASQLRRLARSRGWWTRAALAAVIVACLAPRVAEGADAGGQRVRGRGQHGGAGGQHDGRPRRQHGVAGRHPARARHRGPAASAARLSFPQTLWTAYPRRRRRGGGAPRRARRARGSGVGGLAGDHAGVSGRAGSVGVGLEPSSPQLRRRSAQRPGARLRRPARSSAGVARRVAQSASRPRARRSTSARPLPRTATRSARSRSPAEASGGAATSSRSFATSARSTSPWTSATAKSWGSWTLDKRHRQPRLVPRELACTGGGPTGRSISRWVRTRPPAFTGATLKRSVRRAQASLRGPFLGGETRFALQARRQSSGRERADLPTTAKRSSTASPFRPIGPRRACPVSSRARAGISTVAGGCWRPTARSTGCTAGLLWSGGWRAWRASAEAMAGHQEPWGSTATGAAALAWEKGPWRARLVASHEEDLPAIVLGVDRAILEYGLREHLERFETVEYPEIPQRGPRRRGVDARAAGADVRRLDGAGAPPAARREPALDRGGEPLRSRDRARPTPPTCSARTGRCASISAAGSSSSERDGLHDRPVERSPVPRVVAGRGSAALAAEVVQGLARSRRLGGRARLRPAPQPRR